MEKMAEAQNTRQATQTQAELVRKLEGPTMITNTLENSEVTLPCHLLPFGHNPNLYGRASILQNIQDVLAARDESSRIKSIALWGMGEIGKSEIALEFASRQDSADLPIILCIPSNKGTEIASAFNKAAQKLNLPGVLYPNTPD